MTKSDIAISVNGVYKDFKLPHEKAGSFKNIFTSMFNAVSASRTFTKQHALKDISFNVKKGEFFGIVGRNGSGKSTLLKIIAGIYQPSKGRVTVNGMLVPFIELGVGFNAELTGRENVYLNGALLGFSKKQIDNMYDSIVSFAELGKFMDQKLKNYSSGMQVRLAFSLAIRAETDILLVDEVLAVGDADFQRKCFAYFRKLKRDKKTVIFVSHDMNAVREYCDRAVLIDKSKVVDIDASEKIATKYSKLFLKSETENNNNKDDDSSESKRWGDGTINFKDIKCVKINDTWTIDCSIKSKKDIDDPIYGFVIRDAINNNLFGTNTINENLKTKPIKKGKTIKVSWSFPDIFKDGSYSITVAALYDGGTTVAEWWDDSCFFDVKKSKSSPYFILPKIDMMIKEG